MVSCRLVTLALGCLGLISVVGCKSSSPIASNPANPGTVVAVPARAGAVVGKTENSDAFLWELFVSQIAVPVTKGNPSPAAFETLVSVT